MSDIRTSPTTGLSIHFTVAIYLSYNISFIVSSLLPSVPVPPEFAMLMSVILVVLFALLSFRILLTKREAEIARLIVESGLGNKDISAKLNFATGTVDQYVSSIFRKFGVKSRTEFVWLFIRVDG